MHANLPMSLDVVCPIRFKSLSLSVAALWHAGGIVIICSSCFLIRTKKQNVPDMTNAAQCVWNEVMHVMSCVCLRSYTFLLGTLCAHFTFVGLET